MPDFVSLNNLLLASSFIFVGFIALFPVESWISKLLEVKLSKIYLLAIPTLPLLATAFRYRILGLVHVLLSVAIIWGFLFAFNVDRKYPYILALIFLGFTPFFLMAGLDDIAEYSAILCYLALVIGVFKDIFYEKIFNN
jgi:hypothetical protein